jgi:hypothetical protein
MMTAKNRTAKTTMSTFVHSELPVDSLSGPAPTSSALSGYRGGSAMCVSSVAGGLPPAISRRSPAAETSNDARVLAVLQTLAERAGLLRVQAAVRNRLIEPRRRVPEADRANRAVELACLGRSAQPRRLLLGDPTGLDHRFEPLEEPGRVPRLSVLATALMHEVEFIETPCHCQIK